MSHETKRSQHQSESKQKINGWKWAFLLLAGMIVGLLVWVAIQVTTPVSEQGENAPSEVATSDDLAFEVRSGKDQLALLANQFLVKEADTEQLSYEIVLNEKVQLVGELAIFGINVPFELDMDPYVMEGGNLQLKATALSLGNLKLPLSFVMKQIEKQLPLPQWVTVHPDPHYILVHLDEFQLKSGIHFTMEYVNLSEDDIRVNVFVPNENK